MAYFEKSCSLNQRLQYNVFHIILLVLSAQALARNPNNSLNHRISAVENPSIYDINQIIEFSALATFQHKKTGIIYDVALPSSLAGLTVQVARLRSGSLRRRGFIFNEFIIPSGAVIDTPPRWVAMVYRDFGGLEIYPPQGYTSVAPVLGIKVYMFSFNYTATGTSPELTLLSNSTLITFRIPYLNLDQRQPPYCASFDKAGRITISNVSSPPNACSSTHLGDFTLVIPSLLPSPAPQPSAAYPSSFPSPYPGATNSDKNRHKRLRVWHIALAATAGGIFISAVLSIMVIAALTHAKSFKQRREMEYNADDGEVLQTAFIGETRFPAAGSIRTRPTIQQDSES